MSAPVALGLRVIADLADNDLGAVEREVAVAAAVSE
jgi:hypothetical protein